MNRRNFLFRSAAGITGVASLPQLFQQKSGIMSVNGWIEPLSQKYILPHEHVMVDFIGASAITKDRYDIDEVFSIALPKLIELKKAGCSLMFECTPAYIGRDVLLLKRLSAASGLAIVTNTGYYGASGEKYFPQQVFDKTAEELANIWIGEFRDGIENTGIRPGFIKLGVDAGPLTAAQKKTVQAAAITHLATGLTIGIHTGNGVAATEELDILRKNGVSGEALVWIHAQNEKDPVYFSKLAKQGVWIEFDNVNKESLKENLEFLRYMKSNKLLHKILFSQDSGWYHVGEKNGGQFSGYTSVFAEFIPMLSQKGINSSDIEMIFKRNPAKAFSIGIRKT